MKLILQYIKNILLAIDRLVNAILGGSPEVSISGRLGNDMNTGRCVLCVPICWVLNLFQTNHCKDAAVASDASLKAYEAAQDQPTDADTIAKE